MGETGAAMHGWWDNPKEVMRPPRALVDGAWLAGGVGRLQVFNPSLAEVIAEIGPGTVADVDDAVAAARRSFDDGVWTDLPASARAKILWRAADLIDEAGSDLADLETRNTGMPLSAARRMVGLGAETFRYFAGWCTKIHGLAAEVTGPAGTFHAYTRREPVGVAGLIVPWNAPFVFACNKLAVALAAGCSAVLKPAEETPLTALRLGEVLQRAGVPPGVANIVTGLGDVVGAAMAAHPGIDKIAFTGSTEVGKKIIQASARDVKRLTLELGGKSPVIIFDDADFEAAVVGAARGIFSNAGQVCMAGSRVYVQRGLYDRVVDAMAAAAGGLRVGDGFDPASEMGPLISAKQLERVGDLIQSGLEDNACVVTGGQRLPGPGFYIQPTVLTSPDPGARILREEIFGPVVTLIPFEHLDQVIAEANDTAYGLAAAVWTRDIGLAHRTAKRLKAGTVWLNCQLVTDRMMPFGGYKQSGIGREGGLEGLEAYLETKSVFAAI
ncbi:MAG TPA: aldehyde dehydrogenase family protein [Caulobacteraceae bacterium]|nr:aldehyde dehydrogenase family protein [Caulobacteraceae bacterium]